MDHRAISALECGAAGEGRTIRRTKIVATLGPACADVEAIAALIERGADGLRLNCSHGTPHERGLLGRAVRAAAEQVGRSVALMLDLQGPKVRLDAATPTRVLERGDSVTLVGEKDPLLPGAVRVRLKRLPELVAVVPLPCRRFKPIVEPHQPARRLPQRAWHVELLIVDQAARLKTTRLEQ